MMEKDSLKDKVYKILLSKILMNELKPGTPLDEMKLCQQLNVSRTPLREALNRLERQNAQKRGGSQLPAADEELAECLPAKENVMHLASSPPFRFEYSSSDGIQRAFHFEVELSEIDRS